jgi:hypothetical protein
MQTQINLGVDDLQAWGDNINGIHDTTLIASGPSGGDDTTQLQADINAAITAGRPLRIPTGSYSISSALTANIGNGGVIIKGDGAGKTTITQTTPSENGITISSDSDWDGLYISDLKLVGGGTGNGIQLPATAQTGSGFHLRNVIFDSWNVAGAFLDIDQSLFEMCKFNNGTSGVTLDSSSGVVNAVNFIGCVFNSNTEYGLHIGSGRGINVMGCEFGPDPTSGDLLILWEGQTGCVTGCNFEFHPGNTLSYGIKCDNAGSSLSIRDNIFNGFTTANVPAIRVETNNRVKTENNWLASFASGTPLIESASTLMDISGSPSSIGSTSTSADGNTMKVGDENIRIGPFPAMAYTFPFTPDDGTRCAMLWSIGNTWSSQDDLQAVIQSTDGSGVASYKKTSLLNQRIIDDLEAWTVTNPVTSGSDLATVATAIEALQTVIGNMGD